MTTQQQIKWLESFLALWEATENDGLNTEGLQIMYDTFLSAEDLESMSADELLLDLKTKNERTFHISAAMNDMFRVIDKLEDKIGRDQELTFHIAPDGCQVLDGDGKVIWDNNPNPTVH